MSHGVCECDETLMDAMLVTMMAECRVKTIEGFTNEILYELERREMKRVSEFYEKLQKMKASKQTKHELNYWKVMQCLGEIGIEKLILVVKTNTLHSCQCHVYSNLYEAVNLLCESLTTVNIIKRVLYHRLALVPIFFESLRQTKEPRLVGKVLIMMYRCLIVGKTPVVELYMQHKVLKDIHGIVQKRLDISEKSVELLEYGTKILYGLVHYGDRSVRHSVRQSQALVFVEEYKNNLESKVDSLSPTDVSSDSTYLNRIQDIKRYCTEMRIGLDGGKPLREEQSLRDLLKEECRSERGHFIFCSAPACRKQFQEEKDHFRYCGACRLSRYCSKACQKQHWTSVHRDTCLALECFTVSNSK